ncbi:LOW QUALITY PROTEIN: hypothetical protein OSB04_008139 [Centaurea solstitialis]|uniref:TIR domain-containing protein n=1 Tax=Centaurea solstitialis TaxID=347529 RepID=A0AA38TL78_9ASTR|nr:LOW QUALITY PROTEIN: hypothetical protein OSB04_008139 [Centaurea solstitialis]
MPVSCPKLVDLNFSHSKLTTLDLRGTSNLESLNIEECIDLVELQMPVALVEIHIPVECLKLRAINISDSKLRNLDLPPNLKILHLYDCVDLVELHILIDCLNLEIICIYTCSKLRIVDLRMTLNLKALRVVECVNLVELHIPVECLKLKYFDINSSKLRTLDLRGTPSIEKFHLEECVDLQLHIPVECLKLESVEIYDSKLRTLDLRGTSNLMTLNLERCVNLVKLHIPVECLKLKYVDINGSKLRTLDLRGTSNLKTSHSLECPKLKYFDINGSKLRTLDLRRAPNLKILSVKGCYDLVELHIQVECLKLESICIIGTKFRTFDLGLTPELETLCLIKCCRLVELHAPFECLKKLSYLNLSGCLRFKSFSWEQRFESLEVGCLSELHLIAESVDTCPLHSGNNLPKFRFTCSYEECVVPYLIGNLAKNLSTDLCACTDLERFFRTICGLQCLTKLTLEGDIPKAPNDLGKLECLVELMSSGAKCVDYQDDKSSGKHLYSETSENSQTSIFVLRSYRRILADYNIGNLPTTLWSTKIKHLPDSIYRLKHLKSLKLNYCKLLEKLPKDLGRLECLEILDLQGCIVLRDIPHNICRMKSLSEAPPSKAPITCVIIVVESIGYLPRLNKDENKIEDGVWNPFKSKLVAAVKHFRHILRADRVFIMSPLNETMFVWLEPAVSQKNTKRNRKLRHRCCPKFHIYLFALWPLGRETDDFCILTFEPFLAFMSFDDKKTIRFNTQGYAFQHFIESKDHMLFRCRDVGVARILQSYTLMASSSTSSIPMTSFKYDVFLSFRGEDTRKTFVGHLYDALTREGILTYKDDVDLDKGKVISKELIQAIEDSRFHVIVFSKDYASSSWCLQELSEIMECQNTTTEQTVYPIFYHVEPTEVRKQIGEFGKAFAKHEKAEAAQKWRDALEQAASFSGWDLETIANGHEAEFIKLVVKEISLKLPSMINVDENLVGMRTRISQAVSYLNTSDEFCLVGIAGMGGSGKTTLARAVFDQICNEFEGSSFVENVRECSNSLLLGMKSLQQQVLRDVLNRQDITVNGVFDGKKMMKKYMPGRKALVVLDDVDHIEQLKALAGEPNWFKPGSKIIITTRDKQVLLAHKVNRIHDANLLTNEEAICLLSRCAFQTENPILGFEELSKKVVHYAAGLPLTITVLGSSLCGTDKHVWIDTLEKLKKIPLDEVQQKLELSYMGLDVDCKEIFLDVACILKGRSKDKAIRVLESRGFHAIRGLDVLEKKSLVTTRDGYLDMHDRIQEMGMHIVRRLHPNEPNKHSRLWEMEEIEGILANNQGTQETECIYLFTSSDMNQEVVMKGLEKMEKLRLLLVYINDIYSSWNLDEVRQYFPNSLQYLRWPRNLFRFLPKTFQASDLVGLDMCGSRMEQLWEGGERKVLGKLRFLDLSSSKLRSFDLGLAPNLETLKLKYCHDLVELDMQCECPQLKSLNLSTSKLRSLKLGRTPNIETLKIECSESFVKLDMPCDYPQLKYLKLSCPDLRYFNLGLTPNIEAFPSFISNRIIVSNPGLKPEECEVEFDMSLGCPQLESLVLCIPNLRALDLGSTPNLQTLELEGCSSLVELHMHDEGCKLKTLCLPCQRLRIFDFGLTQNVEALTLDGNDGLVERFIPVRCPQLECLELIESKLRTFELIPNLKTLILKDCDLVEFHVPDIDVKLESLAIKRCSKLKTLDLGLTPNLERLCLKECSSLVKLHAPVGGVKLLINLKGHLSMESGDAQTKLLYSSISKFEFECLYKEDLPSSIGNVEKLISEGLFCACTDLESFFRRICGLQRLTKLKLQGNISELPKDIDRLQCLEELTLWSTKIKHLPDSICRLKHLKSLELLFLLEKLPEDLGQLECLETLDLQGCIVLRDIPRSICRMKSLRDLSLLGCNRVEELPEELGRLECLGYLNIRGTCINNLPQSILLLREQGLRISWPDNRTRATTTTCHGEEVAYKGVAPSNEDGTKLMEYGTHLSRNDFDFCIVTVEPFLAFRSCDDREAIKFNTQGSAFQDFIESKDHTLFTCRDEIDAKSLNIDEISITKKAKSNTPN